MAEEVLRMNLRVLWRLEGHNMPAGTTEFTADLLLYLRHAPLTMVLVQVQGVQRAYIYGIGCAGCPRGRCEPGCIMQLLRRAMLASGAPVRLTPAPYGLARRPYTRVGFAFPRAKAQMLAGAVLERWNEARLCLTWRMAAGRLLAGALLAVGADGPAARPVLHAQGWRGFGLPTPIGQAIEQRPLLEVPCGWPVSAGPHLLMPARFGDLPPGREDVTDQSWRQNRHD